ncbi:MAG TPA: cytochrome c oxidase assembly protein [Streptosporangiaceae bacterium]|nr:cytochrome c oxidase assembly protein [Streptosporangiaceae bacterium]
MVVPFGWQAVFTQWQSAPVVTVSVLVAAGLYLWGVVRVARRRPARPWPIWRTAMFLGGLVIVVFALQSGIGSYDDVLFWDHMVQHLMLVMVAPPFLILGRPITLLMHASRNPLHTWVKRSVRSNTASFLTWPVFGFAAYAAAIVVAHLTGVANVTASNQVAHEAEHLGFLIIGYLFFLPIIGSEPIKWRLSYPTRLVLLFLVMPVDTITGLVLSYGNRGTPGLPAGPRPVWAGTPVGDLHAGGAVMWIGGAAIMFALIMVVFLMWSTDGRTVTRSRGWLEAARRATVAPDAVASKSDIDDDDERLIAYNAYLNRLNSAGHAGERDTPASGL